MTLLGEYDWINHHTVQGDRQVHTNVFHEKQAIAVKSARGFVIIGDKFVLAHGVPLDNWQLPGGGTEENESEFETFAREVGEETSITELKNLRALCYRVNTTTWDDNSKIDQDCILVGYADSLPEFQGDIAGGTDGTRLVTKDELRELLPWGQSLDVLLKLI